MNKKFGILFVFVLLAGAVFLSGCNQNVAGKRIINNNIANEQACPGGVCPAPDEGGNQQLGGEGGITEVKLTSIILDYNGKCWWTDCNDASAANEKIKVGCTITLMACKQI